MPGLGGAYGAQTKGPTVGQVIPSETSSFDYLDKYFDSSGNISTSSKDMREDLMKKEMADLGVWAQNEMTKQLTEYRQGPRTNKALSKTRDAIKASVYQEFERRKQEVTRKMGEIGKDMKTRMAVKAKKAAMKKVTDTAIKEIMPEVARLLLGVPGKYMDVKRQILSEYPDPLMQEYINYRMPDTNNLTEQTNWTNSLVKANTTLENQRKAKKEKEPKAPKIERAVKRELQKDLIVDGETIHARGTDYTVDLKGGKEIAGTQIFKDVAKKVPKTDVVPLYDEITGKVAMRIDVERGKRLKASDIPQGLTDKKPKQEPDPTVDEARFKLTGLITSLAKLEASGMADESSGDDKLDAMIRKTPGLLFISDKTKMSPEAIEEISALYRDRIAFYEGFLPKDELEGLPTETVGTRETVPETFTQTATDADGNKMGWNGTEWVSIPTQ